MNIDFSQARFKHLNWKIRVRMYLDGKETLSPEQAISHNECDLGMWFNKEGKAKYGHLECIQEFEVQHEYLHKLVKKIQELKTLGENETAEITFKMLSLTSDRIVQLLTDAEQQIKAGK